MASAGCVFATQIEHLWILRALQGISAGAGIVVSRAIVRDLYDGPEAQRLMSHISMMFALAPAIAPVIGGRLQQWFGWHSVFVFLVAATFLVWFACWRLLPETLPAAQRQPLHPAYLARAYWHVLTSPAFLLACAGLAFNFGGFFIYVMSAPVFLMRHLGVPETGFFWLFGPAMIGLMSGSWLSGRFAGKITARQTIKRGYLIMGAATLCNIALNLTLPPGLPWSVLPIFVHLRHVGRHAEPDAALARPLPAAARPRRFVPDVPAVRFQRFAGRRPRAAALGLDADTGLRHGRHDVPRRNRRLAAQPAPAASTVTCLRRYSMFGTHDLVMFVIAGLLLEHHARRRHALYRRPLGEPGRTRRRSGRTRHRRRLLRTRERRSTRTVGAALGVGARLRHRQIRRRRLPVLTWRLDDFPPQPTGQPRECAGARIAVTRVLGRLSDQRAEPQGRAVLSRLPAAIHRPGQSEQGTRHVVPRRRVHLQRNAVESLVAWSSATVSSRFKASPAIATWLNRACGGLFLYFSLKLVRSNA